MRLFISIPLPKKSVDSVKNLIGALTPKLSSIKEVKLVPEEKWHLTLVFLGEQNENSVAPISEVVKDSTIIFEAPEIEFEKLKYVPDKNPRMLWLATTKATSGKLGAIKNHIEENLKNKGVKWKQETRSYNGHVTLAKFGQPAIKNLPKIKQEFALSFKPHSVNLVRSVLQKGGSEYEDLFSAEYK